MERSQKSSPAKNILELNANVKELEKSALNQELGRRRWPVACLLPGNLSLAWSSTAVEDKQVPVFRVFFDKA